MNSFKRKLIASTMVMSVALAPASMSPMAFAQETPINDYKADAEISLTIHKYLQTRDQNAGPINAAGEPLSEAPAGQPLNNIEYTLKKITGIKTPSEFSGIESSAGFKGDTLESARNLQIIAQAVKDDPAKALHLNYSAKTITGRTNTSGEVAFSNDQLDGHGAYVVAESDVSAAKLGSEPVKGSIVAAKPFVAIVPITAANGSDYNYDVHAYPKNTSVKVSKEYASVSSKNLAGSALSYMIRSDVPKKSGDTQMTKYVITDNLPNQVRLFSTDDIGDQIQVRIMSGSDAKTSESVKEISNFKTDLDANGVLLQKDTDYEVNLTNVDQGGGSFVITLNDSGLAKLSDAKYQAPDSQVQVFVKTVVTSAVADGTTKNNAEVVFNNGDGGGDVTSEGSTPPGPVFAKLKIKKVDDKTSTALADAEFKLFMCDENNQVVGRDSESLVTTALDKSITSDENAKATRDTFVTNQDGEITFLGLQKLTTDAETTQDGEKIDAKTLVDPAQANWNYCLVETKAPDGYERHKLPIIIENFNRDTADLEVTKEIPNIKKNDFSLPVTGGQGVTIMGIIAFLIAIPGMALAAFKRRKVATEASVN